MIMINKISMFNEEFTRRTFLVEDGKVKRKKNEHKKIEKIYTVGLAISDVEIFHR